MAHPGGGPGESRGATRVPLQLPLDATLQLVPETQLLWVLTLEFRLTNLSDVEENRACPRSHSREVPDLAISKGYGCSLAAFHYRLRPGTCSGRVMMGL